MTRRLLVMTMIVAAAGCTMDETRTPPLAGPSEFGLSLAIAATPDVIALDGQSQSVLSINARNAAGGPAGSVSLRADTIVNGVVADFGTLSSRTVTTNADGVATLTYRAPAPSPTVPSVETLVSIILTPVGTNYANAVSREVQLRVTPVNPIAAFIFTPGSPKAGTAASISAAMSKAAPGHTITAYYWNFGDTTPVYSGSMNEQHTFMMPAVYTVRLTVYDDLGRSSTLAQNVTVQP